MSDNYQFLKSNVSQSQSKYTPYTDKQYNYVNDINNGVYTNTSMSLLQFDLSSIFNSSRMTDTSDHYLVIPTCTVAAYTSGVATLVAPGTSSSGLITLKTSNTSVIHQVDLQIGGKTVDQVQPYHNVIAGWWMASSMSLNDQKEIGRTLGWASSLDSPNSGYYSATAYGTAVNSQSNPGLSNNKPYNSATVSSSESQMISGPQNTGCVNKAIQEKVANIVDSASAVNNFYPTLVTATQLASEFKPYYAVSGNYMIWYDFLVIRVKDLLDSMNNIGLTRRFDAMLRIYVNTGLCCVQVAAPNNANANLQFRLADSTFVNTCPITINNLLAVIPATTTGISVSFSIARPPNYTLATTGFNPNNAGASNLMAASRYYYSQIIVNPSQQLEYLESTKNKTVLYRTFITNQFNAIGSGSSFSALVQSGITNIQGLVIIPSISSNIGNIGFNQWQSPFDPFGGCSFSPLSITNLQVSIGGVNVFQNTMFYSWEEYLEQVSTFDKLSSADFGMSSGLISQNWWDVNRVYWVDCLRCNSDDRNTPRNINISFNNNSNVAMDVLVFVLYLDELSINTSTGIIVKK